MEMEVDEYIKKKYSRTDETIRPWSFGSLNQGPKHESRDDSKQGFYSLSHFAVFKSFTQLPKPVEFPEYLLVSPNYFYRGWSLNTHRRLKNVIVVMEWVPSVNNLELLTSANSKLPAKNLTPEQEIKLKKAFDYFDVDGDQKINLQELRGVLQALEAGAEDEDDLKAIMKVVDVNKTGKLDLADVRRMITQSTFARLQKGRFWLVLSLHEAECIRGHMHNMKFKPVLPGFDTTLGLRVGSYLLDGSYKYEPAFSYQQDTAEQCLRFLNSDIYYQERELNLLLRALQVNPIEKRIEWFDDIRSCRRRPQLPWQQTSLTRVFTMNDEWSLLVHNAIIARARSLITIKGMMVLDAFHAFDRDKDGRLNCSELYAALSWLGVELTPEDVYDVMRNGDSDHDGCLSFLDFSSTFRDPNNEMIDNQRRQVSEEWTRVDIPPKIIKELYELNKKIDKFVPTAITPKQLARLKVKVKECAFDLVWSSEGSVSRSRVSIWRPESETSILERKNKIRTCLSDYAVPSFNNPNKDKKLVRKTIEFTDLASSILSHSDSLDNIVYQILPKPIKYHLIWHTDTAKQPMFAWRPVAPSNDFVSMGMIVTLTSEEPSVEIVRCVPKVWCKPTNFEPVKVWDDSGASAGKKGSIWMINNLGFMAVVEGYEKPVGPFFEIWAERFEGHQAPALPFLSSTPTIQQAVAAPISIPGNK